jgi:hypothetical protein
LLSSLVGILAFYVSFKYYHAPVHAQLNRNATSILRQMQSQHRDQEPNQRHAQERKGCGQGHLPQLRNLRLPHRKRLEPLLQQTLRPSLGLQANPANLLTPNPFIYEGIERKERVYHLPHFVGRGYLLVAPIGSGWHSSSGASVLIPHREQRDERGWPLLPVSVGE